MAARKKEKKPLVYRIMVVSTVVLVLIVCIVTVVSLQSDIAEKKIELDQINRQIDELEEENDELQRILDENNMDSYIEKLAREKYDYAYPDEYRYYDTSRS